MIDKKFINVDPRVWGSNFWKTIYYVILTYDSTDSNSIRCVEMFFFSLGGLLPCPTCQKHYQDYFEKNPIRKVVNNKNELIKWVYNLQRQIQVRNKKTIQPFNLWLKEIKKIL